jgi:hypothetical protein
MGGLAPVNTFTVSAGAADIGGSFASWFSTGRKMDRGIPESDWKVFRELRDVALERFYKRILSELRELADDDRKTSRERYLAVFELIRRRDDEIANAFNDNDRRSAAVQKIGLMHAYGLLTPEELARFTEKTQQAARSLAEMVRP